MNARALLAVVIVLCGANEAAAGAFKGGKQHLMHDGDITVCFVGDAMERRRDRAEKMFSQIQEFTFVANLRFRMLGKCTPPKAGRDGKDLYEGDIRVLMADVGIDPDKPKAGKGCPGGAEESAKGGWPVLPLRAPPLEPLQAAWSNFPDQTEHRLHCQYTMWLPGPSALNVTLHEFGHAVGLLHEHSRIDVDPTYCDNYLGGGIKNGLLTVYDPESVMHYSERSSCTRIVGNYSNAGFSVKDKLALHILYPEKERIAEFVGNTVIIGDEKLALVFGWRRRGAIVDNVARNFEWLIDGKSVGKSHNLDVKLDRGVHTIEYKYVDLFDRAYSYVGTVRSIAPEQFKSTIRAPLAARAVLQ